MIAFPVGRQRPNRAADVRAVQMLLNNARGQIAEQQALRVDGIFGPLTAAAIKRYQTQAVRLRQPDGVIDPGGPTLHSLSRLVGRNTVRGRPVDQIVTSPGTRVADVAALPRASASNIGGVDRHGLSEAAYLDMARRLECEVAAIKAVVETELEILKPFDAQGRPRILFERHKFHKHTNGRYDASHPDISNPRWGGHGKLSEQYPKLERAIRLDRNAALKSASWGAFQILGENHAAAGHATVDAFVAAMRSGVNAQAEAFVAFVKANRRMLTALRQRNWAVFARLYNGPAYADHNYDGRMRKNYHRLTNGV